jgi:hypothetical protein
VTAGSNPADPIFNHFVANIQREVQKAPSPDSKEMIERVNAISPNYLKV